MICDHHGVRLALLIGTHIRLIKQSNCHIRREKNSDQSEDGNGNDDVDDAPRCPEKKKPDDDDDDDDDGDDDEHSSDENDNYDHKGDNDDDYGVVYNGDDEDDDDDDDNDADDDDNEVDDDDGIRAMRKNKRKKGNKWRKRRSPEMKCGGRGGAEGEE